LILAEEVREQLGLKKVIFVPTNLPPHKETADLVSGKDRFLMIKAAIKENNNFEVSDVEIKRQGLSYTIDTIRLFKERYPQDELYFISGSDLLKYLDGWKDLGEILKLVKFVVATRPGFELNKIPSYISTIAIRAVDVSGFSIRQCIKENKSVRYLMPDAVFKYITKRGLYR